MTKGKQPSLRDVLDEVRRINDRIQGREVILEEMRTQNRATIEAVEMVRVTVEQRIDRFERETGDRFTVLEAAVRQNSTDIRQSTADIRKNSAGIRKNGADIGKNSDDIRKNSDDIRKNSDDIRQNSDDIRQNSEDIRTLSARVEALGSLDRRVSVLENRASREG